jgi:hypothetical protein
MAACGAYGYINGDPKLLATPWDSDGNPFKTNLKIANGCGYNTSTLNYPYLYFPAPDVSALTSDPLKAFSYAVCVT